MDFDLLTQHFTQLNNPNGVCDANTSPPSLTETDSSNEFINMDFTVSEVLNGINQLKLNKAPGIDCILNEFIIYAKDEIDEVLTKYFNLILSSGYIPDE